jgi:hypothetical protein
LGTSRNLCIGKYLILYVSGSGLKRQYLYFRDLITDTLPIYLVTYLGTWVQHTKYRKWDNMRKVEADPASSPGPRVSSVGKCAHTGGFRQVETTIICTHMYRVSFLEPRNNCHRFPTFCGLYVEHREDSNFSISWIGFCKPDYTTGLDVDVLY